MTADQRDANEVPIAAIVGFFFILVMLYVLCTLGFENACCAISPDPCEIEGRGHRVIANGKFVGCTSDPTNFRG